MAFAQALLVGAKNERYMCKGRHRSSNRLVQQHLLRCVGDVIVAPNDMRHPHVNVVRHDREVIGWLPV